MASDRYNLPPVMPTYVLRARERFEAAHRLTSYQGRPEPVHGHSWQVEAVVTTTTLDDEGMGFDFVALKSALGDLAARFDHKNVNEVPPFDATSPTTEHLAVWFFEALTERLPNAPLTEVTVWEGPDCSATYRPDPPEEPGETPS